MSLSYTSRKQLLAELLGVEPSSISSLLLERTIPVHSASNAQPITARHDCAAAAYARDACSKALYEAAFLWVVAAVSDSLTGGVCVRAYTSVM